MFRPLSYLAMAFAIALFSLPVTSPGQAADLGAGNRQVSRSDCGPKGCRRHHVVRSRCPDQLSCYPLYGAYGPYGGYGFWSAYSYR